MLNSVLVVDDDNDIRTLMRNILADAGFDVTAVSSGSEAVEAITSGFRPEWLVTDVQMPQMNGRETADALRKIMPGLRVVFMTGHNDDPILAERVAKRQEVMFMKPAAVREVLQHLSS